MISVALLGHGVVGSGVAEILTGFSALMQEKVQDELHLKYILDLREFPSLPYAQRFTKDFQVILQDDDVKIVAEAMGGIHPAYDFAKQCLSAGKSFVTSNKELVAAKGAELLEIARKNNVNFLFEASVGGGIPVLRPMAQCLCANKIESVTGILNGTTNYILNKMITEDMDFEDALKSAQEKGYAEKDPSADIEGHDACRKISILASLAFGRHVYPEQVATEGISAVTTDLVEYANTFNCVVKLIGQTKQLADGTVSAHVRPTLVSREHILSGVNGVFNAIVVHGNQTGDVMFYGKGAGKNPTASAVVADIIDCAKHLHARKYLYWEDGYAGYVTEPDEQVRLFVYVQSDDYDALWNQFCVEFGNELAVRKNEYKKELAFLTDSESEQLLREKIGRLPCNKVQILHTLF